MTTHSLRPPFSSESSLSVSMQDLAIVAPGDPNSNINFGRAEVLMNDNATSALDQLDPTLFPPAREGWLFNTSWSLPSSFSSSSPTGAHVSPITVPMDGIHVDSRSLPKAACPCGWLSETGFICGKPISPSTCAEHLATVHGMRNMVSTLRVECGWCSDGKSMKRESIVRHIREAHLRVGRTRRGTRTAASEPYRTRQIGRTESRKPDL